MKMIGHASSQHLRRFCQQKLGCFLIQHYTHYSACVHFRNTIYVHHCFKMTVLEAREMTQWLRTCAAIAEDPRSFLSCCQTTLNHL